ncbi:MAG TPA: hypothetical protein VKT73_05540 [Xanthobacteraceae bacterium]|nr:hypothetical protein [Xanthobacteraceae bacterium]
MTALAYLFSRLFNALAEARMRQAEIEVRKHHLALIPNSSLARAGLRANYTGSSGLPFVK